MKNELYYIVLIVTSLISCGGEKTKSSDNLDSIKYATQKMYEDSIKRVEELKVEAELKNLRAKGIFGRWECKLSGYESIISFHKIGSTYKSSIEFTESNMKTKTEILKKTNNKYSIIDSKANEYYIINNDGNLELWDKVGLLTTAINIIPGTESKPLPMFDAKTLSGKKFFTIKNNYSKSAPETLQGTNNTYWIVYLADLNTTFRVDKKTENILKAKDGRVPNLY